MKGNIKWHWTKIQKVNSVYTIQLIKSKNKTNNHKTLQVWFNNYIFLFNTLNYIEFTLPYIMERHFFLHIYEYDFQNFIYFIYLFIYLSINIYLYLSIYISSCVSISTQVCRLKHEFSHELKFVNVGVLSMVSKPVYF